MDREIDGEIYPKVNLSVRSSIKTISAVLLVRKAIDLHDLLERVLFW